jgi:tetratricopeptide (TPR) repeat protein
MGARQDAAAANLERALELFEAAGATHPAARVSARVAEITWERGRLEQGLESMDRAFAVLSEEEPDADLAALAAQIGRFMYFAGQSDLALERLDRALEIAESLSLPETIAQALNTKGIVLLVRGRRIEGLALLRKALDVALDHDKPSAALRAYYNLADCAVQMDRAHESAQLARDGLALARRVGNRYWEWSFLAFAYPLFALGDWDEAVAREEALPDEDWAQVRIAFATLLTSIVPVRVHRGQLDEAKRSTRLFAELEASADMQEQAQVHFAEAVLLLAEGRNAEALRSAEASLDTRHAVGVSYEAVRESFVVAVEATLALDDVSHAEELLAIVDTLPPGISPQFLQAHSTRFRARLAARRRDPEEVDRLFRRAGGLFRELGFPFYLAVTLLEQGEWRAAQARRDEAEPLLAEAREIFERLEAKPWLDRLDAVAGTPTEISA